MKRLSALLALAIAVVTTILMVGGKAPRSRGGAAPVKAPTFPAASPGSSLVAIPAHSSRTSTDEGSQSGASVAIDLQLVDAVFGGPVATGGLRVGQAVVWADLEGWCRLSEQQVVHTAVAFGYGYDESAVSQPLTERKIELTPNSTSTVRVVRRARENGVVHPFSGVQVVFERADPETLNAVLRNGDRSMGRSVAVTADFDGRAKVRSAEPLSFRIVNDSRGLLGSGLVAPGGFQEVLVPNDVRSIQVIDAVTQAPLEGTRFLIRDSGARAGSAAEQTSDSSGVLEVPDSPNGVEIQLSDPRYRLAQPAAAGLEKVDRTTLLCAASSANPKAASAPTILLNRQRAGLRIMDRRTGQPIESPTVVHISRFPKDDRVPPGAFQVVANEGGLLTLPALNEEFLSLPDTWMLVCPDGYRWEVLDSLGLVYGEAAGTTELMCVPAPLRFFEVLDEAGRPFRQKICVEAADGRQRYLHGIPDERGRLGPLSWQGDDLIVWRFATEGEESGESGRVVMQSWAAAEIERRELLAVTARIETGSIRVTGVPTGFRVWLLNTNRELYMPSSTEGNTQTFTGVMPGEATLGPLPWIRQLESRSHYGVDLSTVKVQPGDESIVPFDSRWRLDSPIDGRIDLHGAALASVELQPVYGSVAVQFPWYKVPQLIPLDESGRYQLRQGEPMPEALLLRVPTKHGSLRRKATDYVTLQVLDVGGEHDPQLGSLSLHVDGFEPSTRLRAQWKQMVRRLPRHEPVEAKFAAEWRAGEPLHVPCIPQGSHTLEITSEGSVWKIEVTIAGGTETVVQRSYRGSANPQESR